MHNSKSKWKSFYVAFYSEQNSRTLAIIEINISLFFSQHNSLWILYTNHTQQTIHSENKSIKTFFTYEILLLYQQLPSRCRTEHSIRDRLWQSCWLAKLNLISEVVILKNKAKETMKTMHLNIDPVIWFKMKRQHEITGSQQTIQAIKDMRDEKMIRIDIRDKIKKICHCFTRISAVDRQARNICSLLWEGIGIEQSWGKWQGNWGKDFYVNIFLFSLNSTCDDESSHGTARC